jgi:hypothetical protein
MAGNTKRFGALTADGGYPASGPLDGTETTSWVQGGVTVTGTLQAIAALASGGSIPTGTGYRHVTAGAEDAAASTAATVATDLVNAGTGLGSTEVAFRHVPQNSQSAAYTLVASDNGKSIYHPSADTTARIWTIPANASVAYPVGTGSTGSRTLAANGIATAYKMTSTRWQISGVGLT